MKSIVADAREAADRESRKRKLELEFRINDAVRVNGREGEGVLLEFKSERTSGNVAYVKMDDGIFQFLLKIFVV